MTTLSISIQDADNSTIIVNEANITQIVVDGVVFTSANWVYSSGVFTVVLDTSSWDIGTGVYDVSVTTSSTPKLYNNGAATVTLQIRQHNLGISINPPASTPWSWMTDVSFTLIDLDNTSLSVGPTNITQVVIAGVVYTSSNWTCWNDGSASY